jgi:hypothetical protein
MTIHTVPLSCNIADIPRQFVVRKKKKNLTGKPMSATSNNKNWHITGPDYNSSEQECISYDQPI